MRRDSFERFYYDKIALAEGCGCAEHVTRMRDIDDYARMRPAALPKTAHRPLRALVHALNHRLRRITIRGYTLLRNLPVG